MRENKAEWYRTQTESIYKKYGSIRLTDTQISKLITKRFGGEEHTHLMNVRRSTCNAKHQPYVPKEEDRRCVRCDEALFDHEEGAMCDHCKEIVDAQEREDEYFDNKFRVNREKEF